jgi:polyphenol oxidase
MIRKYADSVVWYEFELLQPYPFVHHGTCVIPITPPQIPSPHHHPSFATCTPVLMNQVHGSHVICIDSAEATQPTADAMLTDLPQLALIVKHADCQPCLFFDPEHTALGVAHSGWRSSCLNIYKATVEAMQSRFGTRPEQLIACIGPSLGPCHAEFIHWPDELPDSFTPFRRPGDRFDFWEISRHQLQNCGLTPDHIEIAQVCTRCHSELFCSYRLNKTAERNLSFILYTNQRCDRQDLGGEEKQTPQRLVDVKQL